MVTAVPPLSVEPEPMGPFTVVPPPVQLEQVDEGRDFMREFRETFRALAK